MSWHLRDDPKLVLGVFDFGSLNKAPACPRAASRLPHEHAVPPNMIAHNSANVIVVFNSAGIEKFQSVLADQDVRGLNMSISDIGPKTFVAVRSDITGTIQVFRGLETQHAIMASVVDKKSGETSNKKLTKWNSQCYVVRCIHGLRTADDIMPTYMVEGAEDGLARAEQFMELTGEDIEPVTSANRHLPAEALFGTTLGSNWSCEDAVTDSTSDTPNQFVGYEDCEMFYQNVDHSFVRRLGRQDLTVAVINVQENYTKSHFDESVDLLIRHYSDVLTYRVDVIVARVGKLATDLGEVGRRTNGRHRAEARSCIAAMILESMINKINAKAPRKSEECLTFMVFGNADPYAARVALAVSTGKYTFPDDVDPSVSKDTLLVYYLDWKKAERTASIPTNLSEKSEDTGFNHLPFVHTAHHDTSQSWLDRTNWQSRAPPSKLRPPFQVQGHYVEKAINHPSQAYRSIARDRLRRTRRESRKERSTMPLRRPPVAQLSRPQLLHPFSDQQGPWVP